VRINGNWSGTVEGGNGANHIDWHWRNGSIGTGATADARDIRLEGSIEFTDDESDVLSLSPNGWFRFEESHGFSSRRYQVTADGSGQLTRRVLFDGREHPLDEEAHAWLRAAIPEMLRETAMNAPVRVRRILRQGGPAAVIAEINKIHSSGAKRRYIVELAQAATLNTEQSQSILRLVRGIASDGDKASTLVALGRSVLKDGTREYALDAASSISSSGDRRRVLLIFAEADPSNATLTGVARSAEGIASDGDKASVLVDLAGRYRGNEGMRGAFFRAAESIHSSGDRARVLIAVLDRSNLTPAALIDCVRSADRIPSDGDKARVLMNVLERRDAPAEAVVAAVQATSRVSSDGEKARLLLAAVGHASGKPDVRTEIRNALKTLHSDTDYRRIVTELDRQTAI
jgi:hypothetical protein